MDQSPGEGSEYIRDRGRSYVLLGKVKLAFSRTPPEGQRCVMVLRRV